MLSLLSRCPSKIVMAYIINDLITGLLIPYQKYEALTFTNGPLKLGSYEEDRASYFLVRTE